MTRDPILPLILSPRDPLRQERSCNLRAASGQNLLAIFCKATVAGAVFSSLTLC